MRTIVSKTKAWLGAAVLAAGLTAGSAFAADVVCSNLDMVWHDPVTGAVLRSDPYVCGSDLCGGYRCKVGTEISPACYDAAQCPAACAGECVLIPSAQLDCATLCDPGTSPPPPPPAPTCEVDMTWYKRKQLIRTEPYDCTTDTCAGFRCLTKDGTEISPACYSARECARACLTGTCVGIPTLQQGDCNANLCGDAGSGS